MQAMADQAKPWAIEGHGANFKRGFLEGYALCASHATNFIVWKWNGRPVEGVFLASAGPGKQLEHCEIDDLYTRGNDLIANYRSAGRDRIARQVYWRGSELGPSSSVAIELVLSVYTELLDSAPELSITSYLSDAMLYVAVDLGDPRFQDVQSAARFDRTSCSTPLFLFRSTRLGLSYAQMVHPSDFVSSEVSFDGPQPLFLDTTLFPERLEKGVIRRGRICGWFLPAENDLETAVQLAKEFVNEPLPLTA
jgi:hypothetical protein